MAAKIKTLFDKLGNKLYPKTKTSAVYDDDGVTLNVSLNNYAHFIDEQSTTPISNPILYRSDIDTSTLSESDVKVPSSNLVKTNIDTLSTDLGSKSSASGVTGDDAFSKISTLNSELANYQTITVTTPSTVSGSKTSALPTGFTGSNCVILGAKIEIISGFFYNLATVAQNGVDLVISGTTMYITTGASTPSNCLNKDIIVTLYKHS